MEVWPVVANMRPGEIQRVSSREAWKIGELLPSVLVRLGIADGRQGSGELASPYDRREPRGSKDARSWLP